MTTAAASETVPAAAVTTPAVGASSTEAAAPSAIEYKYDAMEGVTPEFDADISATAKELGLSQEQAAKFRAHEAKIALDDLRAQGASKAEREAAAKIAKEQSDTQRKQAWEKANRDDKDYGGQKYDETSERVNQLFAMAGDRGKALLAEMGDSAPDLLSHPAFRGFLAHFAYKMADGKFHEGATASSKPLTDAQIFYGK